MKRTEVIDLEALRRTYRAIGGEPEDLQDIFCSFAGDSVDLFLTMQSALATQDWPTLKRAAHSLKGAARDFGARQMAEICAGLEHDAEQGSVLDADHRIRAARSAFEAAVTALEMFLNSGELN